MVTRALMMSALVACAGGQDNAGAPPVTESAEVADSASPGGTPSGDASAGDASDEGASTVDDSAGTADWTAAETYRDRAVTGSAVLRAVRTAPHGGFDRIVFEFDGQPPGYRVSYIDRPVRQCGSGDVVPFAGDAWLSMRFEPADAHTSEGVATITERSRKPALPNVIDLKLICDFEAQVEWVAGVHEPLEYRVLTLSDPTRIVVDIRHPAMRGTPSERGE